MAWPMSSTTLKNLFFHLKSSYPLSIGRCFAVSSTPYLKPFTPLKKSKPIKVGECDHGPLVFNISYGQTNVRTFAELFLCLIFSFTHYPDSISCCANVGLPWANLGGQQYKLWLNIGQCWPNKACYQGTVLCLHFAPMLSMLVLKFLHYADIMPVLCLHSAPMWNMSTPHCQHITIASSLHCQRPVLPPK